MKNPATVLSFLDLKPCKYGSMEEYTIFLSRALRERGTRSVVAFASEPIEAVREALRAEGAVLEVVEPGPRAQVYKRLWQLMRRHAPQVVHFHFFEQFSVLPVLSRLAGPKLMVFTDHVRLPQQLPAPTKIQLKAWDAMLAPMTRVRLLTPSHHMKKVLVEHYHVSPGIVQVVHNGVNAQRFRSDDSHEEARRKLGLAAGAPVVMAVAALIREKGLDTLLRAAAQVLRRFAEARFVLVGEGSSEAELRALAKELGIAEAVWFAGLRSDVETFMRATNVVAVPSVWQEPAGLATLEAMASARPVVASRIGGIPEHVQDGSTGILVTPGAVEEFAGAIIRLLEDPALARRMGEAGRERVEREFSMERWIEDTLGIYSGALHQGKPATA